MRRATFILLAAAALVLAACTTATPAQNGGSSTRTGIDISNVWARPAASAQMADAQMGGMSNGAAYMLIRNSGAEADRLLKAESDVAETVELHTVVNDNGVMQMRPVDGIDVPAGGAAELKPGGFHVMLIGLKRDLKQGDRITLILQFQRLGRVSVQADVRQQ